MVIKPILLLLLQLLLLPLLVFKLPTFPELPEVRPVPQGRTLQQVSSQAGCPSCHPTNSIKALKISY